MRTKKHKHHIIPRHAGGTDDPSNIVELTIEEHAEAHRILWEQHRRVEDKIAWDMLSGRNMSEEDRINLAMSGYQSFMSDFSKKTSWRNNIIKARSRQVITEQHKANISKSLRAAWSKNRSKWISSITPERREKNRQAYVRNDMGNILAEARKNSEIWKKSVTSDDYRKRKMLNSPKRRSIVVDGVEYPSIRQAAKETSYTYSKLRMMVLNTHEEITPIQ